jgi:hypothetical protein
MRKLISVLGFAVVVSAWGADNSKTLPPAPDPGPPPQTQDDSIEPQVTIIKSATETRQEYRLNGKLYMIKVTPKDGIPYYLVDETGGGTLVPRGNLDDGVRPPMWVLHSW